MLKKIKGVIQVSITVLLIITLFAITLQRITGSLPGVFGYRIMIVQTGSMEPEIMTNDAILIKNYDVAKIEVGDVICYLSEEKETAGLYITHKVVKAPYEENGETYLITKGVANSEEDNPIKQEQVIGIVVYKFLLLGKIYRFYKTVPGLICIILLILWTIINEIIDIIKTYKEEVKEEEENEKNKTDVKQQEDN